MSELDNGPDPSARWRAIAVPNRAIRVEREVGPWLVECVWPDDVDQGGPWSIRIAPKPDATEDEVSRGISSNVLRQIEFQTPTDEWREKRPAALERAERIDKRRMDRIRLIAAEGLTDEYMAELSALYVALVMQGERSVTKQLAELVGKQPETIRVHLNEARKREMLTTMKGRAGGRLTPYARDVLERSVRNAGHNLPVTTPTPPPSPEPVEPIQIELPPEIVEKLNPVSDPGFWDQFAQPLATLGAAGIALAAAYLAWRGVKRTIKSNRDLLDETLKANSVNLTAQLTANAANVAEQLAASEKHLQRQLAAQAEEAEKNRKVSRRAEDLKVVAKAVELVHKLRDVGHIAELNLYAHEDLKSPHLESEEFRATAARARGEFLGIRDEVPVLASQLQVLGFDDAATALRQMSELAETHVFNPSGKKRASIDEARRAVIKVFTSALGAPEGRGTDLK